MGAPLNKDYMTMQTYTNKEIANTLYEAAQTAPHISRGLAKEKEHDLLVFTFGSLTIRCLPCKAAVLAVADKFDTNKRFTSKSYNETAAAASTRNKKPARITTATLLKRHGGRRVFTGGDLDNVIHL
jgi:hypothetical protein